MAVPAVFKVQPVLRNVVNGLARRTQRRAVHERIHRPLPAGVLFERREYVRVVHRQDLQAAHLGVAHRELDLELDQLELVRARPEGEHGPPLANRFRCESQESVIPIITPREVMSFLGNVTFRHQQRARRT